jgi:hypothetical protein
MTLTTFLFLGPEGPSLAEQWVGGGRWAAACDAVQLVSRLPGLTTTVIASPPPALATDPLPEPVLWDWDDATRPFHFGARLSGLMRAYPADVYLYLGAGSVPLLPLDTLAEAVERVAQAPRPCAITNNLHSSDWLICNCPEVIHAHVARLPTDNALGWVLLREAGIEVRALPATAATRFDIDTPADLLLLQHHPRTAPRLARYLRQRPSANDQWLRAGQRLFTPAAHIALLGRVASAAWAHLEARTQAWMRVFSEERGMVANGREAAGFARSWLGAHYAAVGPNAFFAQLGALAEAAFFDTRVLWAHHQRRPSAADRYAADLGWADAIQDPFLRAFTEAANAAPLALVCGGHSVVAGGLYALTEIAEAAPWAV